MESGYKEGKKDVGEKKPHSERIIKQNRGVGSYASGNCGTGCMGNDLTRKIRLHPRVVL